MMTGILIVNKSKGKTSHNVVSKIRKKLNIKKVGHTGTLDPLATGVLPICIGKATRISDYIMEQGKSYIATLEFGKSTTTYDIEGEIVNISDKFIFSEDEINSKLKLFLGEIEQTPPIYSALKVDGKKLYEYAREGKEVEIKPRKVTIYDIKLLELDGAIAKIEVSCSKGTYIRSLIHDLGINLGSYAHMTNLIRTRVGRFNIENSIDLDEMENLDLEFILSKVVPIKDSLYNLGFIEISDNTNIRSRLISGQKINILKLTTKESNFIEDKDISILINGEFIGIGKITQNILKMEKVLCE